MTPFRSGFSYWSLHVAGWALFALAMMIGRAGEWSLARIVTTELAYAGTAAAISAAMRVLYVRLRLATASPRRLVLVALATSYAGALVWTVVFHLYEAGPGPALVSWLGGVEARGYSGPIFDGAVYHTAVLLGWSALYLGIQYYAALQRERERALRAEADANRAHLQALRYQLNPHFLFNALNGVSTLVAEGDARRATAMLARVSDFLRLTLDQDAAPEASLLAEMDYTQRYLEIERARFGDRLRTRFDIDDGVLSAAIPALLLQPIVENAVKHAVAPHEAGAEIRVAARREGDRLRVDVCDSGPGLQASGDGAPAGLGIGLANVRDRLREMHGAAGTLSLHEAPGGGLCVQIGLPFRAMPVGPETDPSALWAGAATPAPAAP